MPKVGEGPLAARRRQILDAALVCFSRRGFHQASMQAIFEESGLSPGAVYRYFKSKEEIVEAIAMETLGGFAAALEAGPPGRPDELMGRILDTIEAVELRDHRLRLALQVWGEALFNPAVAALVRKAIEVLHERVAAELECDDPQATARVLVAIAQGSVVQRDVYGDRFDPKEFRAAAVALLSHPVVADALDPEGVARAVAEAEPEVIVHQLTALSRSIDMRHLERDFAETNRLRTEGTDHLLAAGRAVGVRRFVAQSFAGWPSARIGGPVKTEADPLDPAPPAGLRGN